MGGTVWRALRGEHVVGGTVWRARRREHYVGALRGGHCVERLCTAVSHYVGILIHVCSDHSGLSDRALRRAANVSGRRNVWMEMITGGGGGGGTQ